MSTDERRWAVAAFALLAIALLTTVYSCGTDVLVDDVATPAIYTALPDLCAALPAKALPRPWLVPVPGNTVDHNRTECDFEPDTDDSATRSGHVSLRVERPSAPTLDTDREILEAARKLYALAPTFREIRTESLESVDSLGDEAKLGTPPGGSDELVLWIREGLMVIEVSVRIRDEAYETLRATTLRTATKLLRILPSEGR